MGLSKKAEFKMSHILITNDDGVSAPGIDALAEALAEIAQVTVIAPDRNWSASGHVKTMHRPLRVRDGMLRNGRKVLVTDGAPSDAIALGLMGLVSEPVDLVVSGINRGANVGSDLTYSGTVTAAMEGTIGGVPSFAISLDTYEDGKEYAAAARFAQHLAQVVIEHGLPDGVLLNVNVPCLAEADIRGVQVTRTGRRIYRDVLVVREDPFGTPYYWIGGDPPTGVTDHGTDLGALASGHISVTPIKLDFTDHDYLGTLQTWSFEAWR
jgi:5'-nucleotidase